MKAIVAKLKPHVLSCGQKNPGFEPLHLFSTGLAYVDAFRGDAEGRRDGWATKPVHLGIPIPPRIWLIYAQSCHRGFQRFV